MKVVIIGGVAGGATAAARLRRLDEGAEIVILERTGYVSYANCGLPYFVGGVITDRDDLTLQTPEGFRRRFGIDVRVGHEALELHPAEHTVEVRNLADGSTYTETYDKLILSPGARPVKPGLPGEDDPRVFTLRTVEDTFRIRDYLDTHPVRRAVVVGGGFIGLEAAENLLHAGVATTLLQKGDQVLPPLTPTWRRRCTPISGAAGWSSAWAPTSPALCRRGTACPLPWRAGSVSPPTWCCWASG